MNDTVPNETALQEEVQLLLQAKPARLLHFGFFLISAVLVWGSVTFVPDFLGLEPLGRQNLSQVLFVHYGTFFVLLWGGYFVFPDRYQSLRRLLRSVAVTRSRAQQGQFERSGSGRTERSCAGKGKNLHHSISFDDCRCGRCFFGDE